MLSDPYLLQKRWLPCRNVGGVTIPPFAVMEIAPGEQSTLPEDASATRFYANELIGGRTVWRVKKPQNLDATFSTNITDNPGTNQFSAQQVTGRYLFNGPAPIAPNLTGVGTADLPALTLVVSDIVGDGFGFIGNDISQLTIGTELGIIPGYWGLTTFGASHRFLSFDLADTRTIAIDGDNYRKAWVMPGPELRPEFYTVSGGGAVIVFEIGERLPLAAGGSGNTENFGDWSFGIDGVNAQNVGDIIIHRNGMYLVTFGLNQCRGPNPSTDIGELLQVSMTVNGVLFAGSHGEPNTRISRRVFNNTTDPYRTSTVATAENMCYCRLHPFAAGDEIGLISTSTTTIRATEFFFAITRQGPRSVDFEGALS